MTNQNIKYIRSLHQKKYRAQENKFLVEGEKDVLEVLASDFEIDQLFFTEKFVKHQAQFSSLQPSQLIESSAKQLTSAGTFKTNDAAIAIVNNKPSSQELRPITDLAIALDAVRDPGNLGTIIRIADWYGIKDIFCSTDTAEWQNPKVISASKGSFTRVNIHYVDLAEFLEIQNKKLEIFGAFMHGENLHQTSLALPAILVMGNESQGIGQTVSEKIKNRLTIPSFGQAESLNVGIATAIFCDAFRRI